MSVMIDFPPPVEARLAEEAQKEGVSVDEITYRTVTEKFSVSLDECLTKEVLIEEYE